MLTKEQKSKLPEKIQTLLEKFHHDPRLLATLRAALSQYAQKVAQDSIRHNTFCDNFPSFGKAPDFLLKLYGMSQKEMAHEMQKIGFVEIHRMYKHPYYQVFCLAYLVGLEFDDDNVRRMALLMIDIRIWNGRKHLFFPKFCDEDTARYAMNYVIKGNHTLKKIGGNAFKYLDEYSIPAVDDKYSKTIPDNLDSFTEGLRKLIETNHSRFYQLFMSIQKAYYKTHGEGKKEIISGLYANQYGDGDMVETRETFSGTVERLVDKIQKNALLKTNILNHYDAKAKLKKKFMLSDASIRGLNTWLDNDDNQEELRYFFELVLTNFRPKDESDICKFNVEVLSNKITGAKKDPDLLKAKEVIEHAIMALTGDKYNKLTKTSLYRAKLIVSYSLVMYMKLLLCKKL